MYTITNTVRDITKLSNERYTVTSATALASTTFQAKCMIVKISKHLKLNPSEFLIVSETGKKWRFSDWKSI